jgi:hypothetical protein
LRSTSTPALYARAPPRSPAEGVGFPAPAR